MEIGRMKLWNSVYDNVILMAKVVRHIGTVVQGLSMRVWEGSDSGAASRFGKCKKNKGEDSRLIGFCDTRRGQTECIDVG